MEHYDDAGHINVGVGQDISIKELAVLVSEVVGYSGDVAFDETKPDGTPRKALNVDRLSALGWTSRIALRDGLAETYRWYLENGEALAAE